MKMKLVALLALVGLASGVALTLAPEALAAPVDVFQSCKQGVDNDICDGQAQQKLFGPGSVWNRVLNIMIFLVGVVAVIMIIVGGLRYVLSGGDSNAVNGAKNTILYSVVGVVIAVMSYAIVNFVIVNL